jgi:hypothetical protein
MQKGRTRNANGLDFWQCYQIFNLGAGVGNAVGLSNRLGFAAIVMVNRDQVCAVVGLEGRDVNLLPKPSAHKGDSNFCLTHPNSSEIVCWLSFVQNKLARPNADKVMAKIKVPLLAQQLMG